MLSVVVPIYNEEENITAFHAAVRTVMESLEEHWEVIYVNDGSRDKSLSLLLGIQRRDPRVSVVEFSRNFGHQAALTAGLQVSRGDGIMLMDGDFQDPPEVLPGGKRNPGKAFSTLLQSHGPHLGFPHPSERRDFWPARSPGSRCHHQPS